MESTQRRSYSIMMFPWLAHGHISPFLELGKRLAKRSFKIYLCSTPVNLNSIKSKLSEKESTSIQMVELHLPSLSHLPPHYHTTKNLPPHLMTTLKKAFAMSVASFHAILENLNPNLVIYDFIQTWAPALASSLNIPAVSFTCFPASVTSCLLHLRKQGGDHDDRFPSLAGRLEKIIEQVIQSASSDLSNDIDQMFAGLKMSTDIVLIKSFRKLEGKYIEYLETNLNKKIVPVGPLVQEPTYGEDDRRQMEMISQWLDKKEKGSTVFVSFGSEYFLSKEEMEEVAYGLELSEVNFIWTIRFPLGEKMKLEEALPKGYLERVSQTQRGLVLQDWAPQMMIIGHPSVGGFVSHCGWNSTLESMKLGVPIVAIPMQLDQPVNAEVVEDVGVGIKVRRKENGGGGLDRVEIARSIRMVVLEESGEHVRRKAKEMSEHMEGEGEEEIDEVVQELVKLFDARNKLSLV